MEKLIIYFDPQNKKIQLNQFHVEAENISDGISILHKNAVQNNISGLKVMGCKNYPQNQESSFINLKFY